jgi:hypothetical protein
MITRLTFSSKPASGPSDGYGGGGNGGIDGEECLAPGVTRAKSTRAEAHRRGVKWS